MLLLDSHAVLWLVADPARLGVDARRRVEDAASVYVSSISLTEFAIKAMLGRLQLPDDFADALVGQGLLHLGFAQGHADALKQFPELVQHDPFDRMLLAQAVAEGLTFVTADRRLLALDRPWILDAAA